MPNISFYANEQDCELVVDWINAESELAYLVRDGDDRWKAVSTISLAEAVGKLMLLWHVPTGPLPLYRQNADPVAIENPWAGWKELKTGADKSLPWFGPTYVGVIHLQLQPVSGFILDERGFRGRAVEARERVLSRSTFAWLGKAYQPIPSTTACWKRIDNFIYKQAVPVNPFGYSSPNRNPTPDSVLGKKDYVALPGALLEMQNGTPWAPNPDV